MCIEVNGDTLVRFEGQDEYYAVPDGVRRLADNAFYDRGRLIELTLPDSVTEIGDYAFKICSNMVRLRLPARVDRLGIGAFQQCRKLERVDLPEGVREIDAGMFVCCDFLSSLTIPATVQSIDPIAFATCRNLREIHIAPAQIDLLPDRQRVLAAITYMREVDPAGKAGAGDATDDENVPADGQSVIHAFIADRAEQIGRILIDGNDKKALNYMIQQGLIGSAAASALLEQANKAHRTELAAMLLSRRRRGEELFEADPFA
ncbi:MAG: leucine-rich repeat domain-containing protein [Mogibacterium sp.]|nr:leucine-rich repeat domain-containing protein [Mogibacterium sp.]